VKVVILLQLLLTAAAITAAADTTAIAFVFGVDDYLVSELDRKKTKTCCGRPSNLELDQSGVSG